MARQESGLMALLGISYPSADSMESRDGTNAFASVLLLIVFLAPLPNIFEDILNARTTHLCSQLFIAAIGGGLLFTAIKEMYLKITFSPQTIRVRTLLSLKEIAAGSIEECHIQTRRSRGFPYLIIVFKASDGTSYTFHAPVGMLENFKEQLQSRYSITVG